MRYGLMFSAIFSIAMFAGLVSGQQTRLIFGNEAGIWRDSDGGYTLLPNKSVGTIQVRAGQMLRLRIASTNNRGKLIVGVDDERTSGGMLFVATDVGVYQVPCTGPATRIGVDAGTQLTISGTVSDPILNWKTEKGWTGTCRMLTIKLRDGTETRAKVRFE